MGVSMAAWQSNLRAKRARQIGNRIVAERNRPMAEQTDGAILTQLWEKPTAPPAHYWILPEKTIWQCAWCGSSQAKDRLACAQCGGSHDLK